MGSIFQADPIRKPACETDDGMAYVVVRPSRIIEKCKNDYGVTVSNAAIYSQMHGLAIRNDEKRKPVTIIITDAMIALARKLNSMILESFPTLTLNDLLPGGRDLEHVD